MPFLSEITAINSPDYYLRTALKILVLTDVHNRQTLAPTLQGPRRLPNKLERDFSEPQNTHSPKRRIPFYVNTVDRNKIRVRGVGDVCFASGSS